MGKTFPIRLSKAQPTSLTSLTHALADWLTGKWIQYHILCSRTRGEVVVVVSGIEYDPCDKFQSSPQSTNDGRTVVRGQVTFARNIVYKWWRSGTKQQCRSIYQSIGVNVCPETSAEFQFDVSAHHHPGPGRGAQNFWVKHKNQFLNPEPRILLSPTRHSV